MDKKPGDTQTTLGPEWLLSPKETNRSAASLEEDSSTSVNLPNGPKTGRVYYSHSKRIPLKFTRSKSTPLLGNLEPREEKNDAFSMLKERGSFESNFPTLQPWRGETAPRPPTAWRRSADTLTDSLKASPPVAAPEVAASPPLHELAGLVPSIAPPKAKKDSKGRFNPSIFRKASSEPNLPIPSAYADNYARLISKRQEKTTGKTNDKPKGTVVLNREEFVRGLARRDGTNSPTRESSPSRKDFDKKDDALNSDETASPSEGTETNGKSPKLVSVEDEERFLRDLGWVPEEEHHVPELTEEEIMEVKSFMSNKIGKHKPAISLDVSIGKWQNDKFQSQPVK